MNTLPKHGRINCSKCFSTSTVDFDITLTGSSEWRITANPLSWGSIEPEIIVLGFSKGPTQKGALANTEHNLIAYKGSRTNVGKILSHIGVLPVKENENYSSIIDKAIADKNGEIHFGSFIRCTVERFHEKTATWKGSGGGMLDKFIKTTLGQKVANNCTTKFLSNLPNKTKLIVMFGLGTKLNYVQESYNLYQFARPGEWKWINDVSYTDGRIVVVHVEHFASQGALIPNWLGEKSHDRSKYGIFAKKAVIESGLVIH